MVHALVYALEVWLEPVWEPWLEHVWEPWLEYVSEPSLAVWLAFPWQ